MPIPALLGAGVARGKANRAGMHISVEDQPCLFWAIWIAAAGEGGHCSSPDFGFGASRFKMPVCSTSRGKSGIVFSLMVEGEASFGCRIFGTSKPVRMARSQAGMRYSNSGSLPEQWR
jgi:hypothetical protein